MSRRLALSLAALVAAVWLTPFLLVTCALPRLAARAGGLIEVAGARPVLPLGVRATQFRVARDGRALALEDVRAVLLPSGPRLDARVADGTLLARGDGWLGGRGFVRIQDIELESLAAVLAMPLALRGRADGRWRFGPDASIEGSVSRGALLVQRPAQFEIPFAQLVVSAARDDSSQQWNVSWVDVQGPPLSASASGTIGADGELAIQATIRQLEEPVRSFFGLVRIPTEPLPLTLQIEGTLAAPRFVTREATSTAPTR